MLMKLGDMIIKWLADEAIYWWDWRMMWWFNRGDESSLVFDNMYDKYDIFMIDIDIICCLVLKIFDTSNYDMIWYIYIKLKYFDW